MVPTFSKSKNILTEKEHFTHTTNAEAVVRRCSVEKVFLEISQNSQENTCNLIKKETLAQVFSCEFWEISKNAFFYATALEAASVYIFEVICGKWIEEYNI